MGSTFHLLCPKYIGALTPTAPTAFRLRETFTLSSFTVIYLKLQTEKNIFLPVRSFRNEDLDKKSLFEILG